MPTGICESLSIDFSIQQKQNQMKEHLHLWTYVCSRKCQLAHPEEKTWTEDFGNFCPKIFQLFSEPQNGELFMFATTF